MELKINGKLREVPEGINLRELLRVAEVKMPEMVSVQVNGQFVRQEKFAETLLQPGDEIEFLYFMGGGA